MRMKTAGAATTACAPPASTTSLISSTLASPAARGYFRAHTERSCGSTSTSSSSATTGGRTRLAGFQTLLGLGAIYEPTTYRRITEKPTRKRQTEQNGSARGALFARRAARASFRCEFLVMKRLLD